MYMGGNAKNKLHITRGISIVVGTNRHHIRGCLGELKIHVLTPKG